jgi:competence protein ComEC
VTARFGLLKPARAVVCIGLLVLFLIVVPPRAPTVRAAVIAFVFLLSIFFRRHPNSLNTLSIAAIILLLAGPTSLFEAGWQLSFATVLGILMFCKRFYFFLDAKLFPESLLEKHKRFSLLQKITRPVLGLFTTGLAAWIGGAGILLHHFYAINPLASIYTVAAFPLVAAILGVGFLKILMSFLLPSISALLGLALGFLSTALIGLVKFFARFDLSEILIGQVPVAVVFLYYSGIAVIVWAWYLRRAARRIVVACSVVAVVGTIGFIKWQRTYPNDLRMTCLDVGHGQAIVMQSAGGTFLFDAGSQYNHNIGWRIVRPFLRYDGISEIDAIIVSHDDVDHINGIVEIVKNCNVHNVYASEAFTKKTSLKGTARYLANCLSEKGISLQPLPDSMNMNAPAPVKILWPDEAACENEALSDNETSVVSLVEFGGRRMLLCSDIEGFAQGQLAARCPDLRADVVVVPHHGSLRSGKAEFIGRFGAEHLVCSCGRSYFEGLQRKGSELTEKMLYTARDGAIFVCINGSGDVRVRTFNDN